MTIQTVYVPLATLDASGDLGDSDDTSGPQVDAFAITGTALTTFEGLTPGYYTTDTIAAIKLRVRVGAWADGFTPTWTAANFYVTWRSGLLQAFHQPAVIPTDGSFAWVETDELTTAPDNSAWDYQSINALEVAARVAWSANATGSVTLRLTEAQVLVYGEQDADVRAVAVGAGTPPTRWTGGDTQGRAVGEGDLPVRWVGEEE